MSRADTAPSQACAWTPNLPLRNNCFKRLTEITIFVRTDRFPEYLVVKLPIDRSRSARRLATVPVLHETNFAPDSGLDRQNRGFFHGILRFNGGLKHPE